MASEQPTIECNKSIWSPSKILVLGVFFSFLSAGILNAISWKRCGCSKKFKRQFAVTIVFVIIMIISHIIIPNICEGENKGFNGFLVEGLINMSMIAYFYEDQRRLFTKQSNVNVQKASMLSAIVISVPCLVALILLVTLADFSAAKFKKIYSLYQFRSAFKEVELHDKDAVPFLLLTEDFEKAEKILDHLVIETPDDPDIYADLALVYINTYRLEDSRKVLDTLAKLDPKYEGLNEIEEAYQTALNDPIYKDWSAGLKLLKEMNYNSAEKSFLDFKGKHPEEVLVYIRLAEVYQHTGRTGLAEEELNYALKLDPSNKEAKSMLEEIKLLSDR